MLDKIDTFDIFISDDKNINSEDNSINSISDKVRSLNNEKYTYINNFSIFYEQLLYNFNETRIEYFVDSNDAKKKTDFDTLSINRLTGMQFSRFGSMIDITIPYTNCLICLDTNYNSATHNEISQFGLNDLDPPNFFSIRNRNFDNPTSAGYFTSVIEKSDFSNVVIKKKGTNLGVGSSVDLHYDDNSNNNEFPIDRFVMKYNTNLLTYNINNSKILFNFNMYFNSDGHGFLEIKTDIKKLIDNNMNYIGLEYSVKNYLIDFKEDDSGTQVKSSEHYLKYYLSHLTNISLNEDIGELRIYLKDYKINYLSSSNFTAKSIMGGIEYLC
jgi:hypothetical protein